MAGVTHLPVVRYSSKIFNYGWARLPFIIVQMPKEVPVATVAIDGGENGASLSSSNAVIKISWS